LFSYYSIDTELKIVYNIRCITNNFSEIIPKHIIFIALSATKCNGCMKNVNTSSEAYRGFMMRTKRRCRDEGVSPVVGVMLMLVVTIIIAAVVSAYAGGLTSGEKKVPSVALEVHLKNDGSGSTYMMWKVLSVSEGIPTKDLTITTSWVNASGGRGGAKILPNSMNTRYTTYPSSKYKTSTAPAGAAGPGVVNDDLNKIFGNYSWVSGTTMTNWPTNYGWPVNTTATQTEGATKYNYWPYWDTLRACSGQGGTEQDSFEGMLGCKWESLRPGDTITVKVVHNPSGKVIVNQNYAVEG
jgi:flagellin-like protein